MKHTIIFIIVIYLYLLSLSIIVLYIKSSIIYVFLRLGLVNIVQATYDLKTNLTES